MLKRAHLTKFGPELNKNDREILIMQIMIDEHDINILEKEMINFIPWLNCLSNFMTVKLVRAHWSQCFVGLL